MTHVRVKGFQIFTDRHGRRRCYHRATRTPVDLAEAPIGSAGFLAICSRIEALQKITGPAGPGTLGLLIAEYRRSPVFRDLATRTRSDYQRVFNYLKPIGDTPLVRFDRPLVVRIRDRAAEKHGRRFGTYVKQVLSLLFRWGAERGFLKGNPADGIRNIRRPRSEPQANRPWSDAEREAVMSAAPAQMRAPLALMMFCGLDPQDALRLPRSALRDGLIDMRRGKTGAAVRIPVPAPVATVLDEAPAHNAITVASTMRGTVWTGTGFRASWQRLKVRLESEGAIGPGLTLKGLRHTVATILAEMGHDDRTIADMLGQRTLGMAQLYSRRADRSRKMVGVVRGFDAEVNRRRMEIVKPSGESVKP